MRASAAAERAGYPTVSIVASGFLKLAAHVTRGLGTEFQPIAEYPGVPMMDSSDELARKIRESVVPRIIAGLTIRPDAAPQQTEPDFDEVVFKGTLQDVQDFFYANAWTDGLPILPPTRASVERMLRFTELSPREVLGILPPENREATVWNTAVNGVMAGCRPEYMPVLLSLVQAIADPEFRLQDAGATPGWEPLIVVSGPIVKQLDFNYGAGVMRAGRQANTTIGRFLKLFMRNIAGIRIPPGEGDKGSIGSNFNVALAEDEDSARELGWSTFAVDRGFLPHDSVVTVQSVVYTSPPIYSGGASAEDHLRLLADVFGQTCAYRTFIGVKNHKYSPLLVLGPSVARTIAADGLTKDDIRQFLYEHAMMPAESLERYAWHAGHTTYSLRALVEEGAISEHYYQSSDPQRLVRVFVDPAMTSIVVAGDPGRNQSRGYVNNHIQGAPVSKKVAFPRDWETRLKEHSGLALSARTN